MNLVRINVMLKKQNNDTCLEAENSFCFQWRKASKLPSTVNNGIHAYRRCNMQNIPRLMQSGLL
jgi:hypothetical protein